MLVSTIDAGQKEEPMSKLYPAVVYCSGSIYFALLSANRGQFNTFCIAEEGFSLPANKG